MGSVIKIAMLDWEIRVAGNLLGPEQHGFITSVGFELYCRLLEEAIRELKGEVTQKPPEPVFDLQVDAYIPDDYVPDTKQKVELYQRIIELDTLETCDDLEEEILDRFGDLPTPVQNLMEIARIKVLARFVGISTINVEKTAFVLRLLEGLRLDNALYTRISRKHRGRISYRHGRIPQLRVEKSSDDQTALAFLAEVLMDLHNE